MMLEGLARRTQTPQWVLDMHEHFAQTGEYRPEDLARVLGNPAEPFVLSPSTDPRLFFNLNQ
jgi:hypothetical protein